MARLNGYYNVKHHGTNKIMLWTTTNEDNTKSISGFWTGHNGYKGDDHDMSFIDEKKLTDREILEVLNKK